LFADCANLHDGIVYELQVEMERIARQNLEAELQRTLEKLSSSTAACNSLQQTELVTCPYGLKSVDIQLVLSSISFCFDK